MLPPHLPEKKETNFDPRSLRRIKILIITVFFALLAGMTGALMVLGWVWPYVGEGDSWALSQNRNLLPKGQLEERVKTEMSSRVGVVYDKQKDYYGLNYFDKIDELTQAILVSSDGWMVAYYPTYTGYYKNWKIVLENEVFNIEESYFDDLSGFLFMKLEDKGSDKQFKVVGFEENYPNLNQDLYVDYNNDWDLTWVEGINYTSAEEIHYDITPTLFYELNKNYDTGSVVINDQGRVIGFVNEKGLFNSILNLTRILPKVLSGEELSYESLGVAGWYSLEKPIVYEDKLIDGFMVSRITDSRSVLKLGDVVLSIDKNIVKPDEIWYIIKNSEMVEIEVLRNGKTIILTQSVFKI